MILSGVLLALFYVPVPLGSNRAYAWLIFELIAYGLLALWAVGSLVFGDRPRFSASATRIVWVFGIWLALILVQSVEIPKAAVAVLSPFAFALQRDLALINVTARSTLSIDPGTSYNEFLKYGAYITIFFLILATVTTRARLLLMVGAIVAAGVLEALFGLYSQTSGYVIFPETGSGGDLRMGTFVNRNHFANLLTMVLGVVIGLLTARINTRAQRHGTEIGRYGDLDIALVLVLAVAALVIVAAIFMSGSRSPLVFFSISYAGMLVLARRVRSVRGAGLVLAPIILAGVAALIVFMGYEASFIRLFTRDILGGERMTQDLAGLNALSHVWLTGAGAGNYRWIFPMFRGDALRFVTYDHAHNDYLETAIDEGIPVAAILGFGVILIVRMLYRGYRYRKNPLNRGVIFGCLIAMVYMLLHGLVGFNFRIPANAVYFFAIAAVGMAACRIDRHKSRSGSVDKSASEANEHV